MEGKWKDGNRVTLSGSVWVSPRGRLGAQQNKRTRDPVCCCIDLGENEQFQLSDQ